MAGFAEGVSAAKLLSKTISISQINVDEARVRFQTEHPEVVVLGTDIVVYSSSVDIVFWYKLKTGGLQRA